MVAVGAVAGQPPADFGTEIMAAFRKSMSFAAFSAATVTPADRRAVPRAVRRSQPRRDRSGGARVLPLDEAVLAHRKMDAGEVFGRIVLTP